MIIATNLKRSTAEGVKGVKGEVLSGEVLRVLIFLFCLYLRVIIRLNDQ